jgi:formylglycine-generating enzyme required for sulfatase activity
MNHTKRLISTTVATACVCLCTHTALANNLTITSETLQAGDAGYTFVKADIRWDNSWKASWTETRVMPNVTVTNWDAAWIFVKYRVATNNAPWQHASLSTNNSDHIIPAQAMVNVGLSTNAGGTNFGCGVFLYRSADGSGSWTNTIKLRWNYAQDGVASTANVDVSVHAIEMVYVPQGSFYVGSGGTDIGSFTEGNVGTTWVSGTTPSVPLAITGEGALTIANTAGNLWGTATSGNSTIGSAGTLPEAYPKGFNAFYCMKYEISQGQWVGFFNMLTDSQKTTAGRDITAGTYNSTGKANDAEVYRNTVSWIGIGNDATCTTPDRACNFLSWADGAAYADWAGLRPMTELEFEKACRGPLNPVAGEYAWGNTTISATTAIVNDGTGLDTATGGNCNYNTCVPDGPYRVGMYATVTSDRTASGATYWGIMEMSGSLLERPVTVGNAGRTFTGTLGDGKLEAVNGNANADFWPISNGTGAGVRGGDWNGSTAYLRASDRTYAASVSGVRSYICGFRAVRPVSSVVP